MRTLSLYSWFLPYLATRLRPDMFTTVSLLAKYQDIPAPKHCKAMKHAVRYLKNTIALSILLPVTDCTIKREVWSDADWMRDPSSRRSRKRTFIFVGCAPVVWSLKLQSSVALSTSVTEFYALADTVCNRVWVCAVLCDLRSKTFSTAILQRNLEAISWSEEVQGLRNVKQIGIKFLCVR